MLLLSWITQGGGRGIVTLDLLSCTEVRSVASLTHPSSQDVVGTIAAKADHKCSGGGVWSVGSDGDAVPQRWRGAVGC